MRWDEERRSRAALTMVCEAALPAMVLMVAQEGAAAVWADLRAGGDNRWSRRAAVVDLDGELARAQRAGVRFVVPGDEEWPDQLSVLDQANSGGLGGQPLGLWLRGPGNLAEWTAQAVALVGSRASTAYGNQVASGMAVDLAGAPGWTVVSGGAYGIDGAAHRGALAVDGRTVGVMAGGLDECYPRGNQHLFEQMVTRGLLVSEVPCGMRPTKVGFLARNRVIAALSVGTVVVEGASRSGAANTASWASECNRVLMAVPGPVFSEQSVTPHRLVRDGRAHLVQDGREVLALVEPLSRAPLLDVGGPERPLDGVDPQLLAVREALPGRGAMPAGVVARVVGLPLPVALARLGQLRALGLVHCDEVGEWALATPAGRRSG